MQFVLTIDTDELDDMDELAQVMPSVAKQVQIESVRSELEFVRINTQSVRIYGNKTRIGGWSIK